MKVMCLKTQTTKVQGSQWKRYASMTKGLYLLVTLGHAYGVDLTGDGWLFECLPLPQFDFGIPFQALPADASQEQLQEVDDYYQQVLGDDTGRLFSAEVLENFSTPPKPK